MKGISEKDIEQIVEMYKQGISSNNIDGNSLNNEISNFRLVCPNCDAQLPTFKPKNIGNGRKYDREYHKRK